MTPFLYFGPINFDFVFHMFFLYASIDLASADVFLGRMRYCRALEDEWYRRRPADFLVLMVFGATLMLVPGPWQSVPFFSSCSSSARC